MSESNVDLIEGPLSAEDRATVKSEYSKWGPAISHKVLTWFIPRALADLERLESELEKALDKKVPNSHESN